jgi:hypothetical protein
MPLKVEQVRQSDVFVGFLLFRPRVNETIVLLDLRFFEVFRFRPRARGTSLYCFLVSVSVFSPCAGNE